MENQSPTPCWWERPRVRGLLTILGLLGFGVVATLLMDAFNADLSWTGAFYREGGPNEGWIYGRSAPWSWLYDYGELPAFILLAAALAIYIASRFGHVAAEYRKPCLVVILTVILGPGILVNGVFKNYWGRPRPAEITTFGGAWEYRTPTQPGVPGRGKSFTCGHCAMAFAVASGAAVFPIHRGIALVFLASGIAYGAVMGVARMAQGGHFPTDVLWSGVIVMVVLAALYYLVLSIPEAGAGYPGTARSPTRQRPLATIFFVIGFILVPCTIFLDRAPLYGEFRHEIPVPTGTREVRLTVDGESATSLTTPPHVERIEATVVVSGFGAPWAKVTHEFRTHDEDGLLTVSCSVRTTGFLSSWKPHGVLAITENSTIDGKLRVTPLTPSERQR